MCAELTSTCQHLAYFARARPDSVAIVREDGTCDTYARLARLVVQHVLALEALGVRPGMLVGLASDDRHLHLLLVLACQAMGAVSVSFSPIELQARGWLAESCGLIICGDPGLAEGAPNRHFATPSWARGILRLPVTEQDMARLVQQVDPARVIRLIKTSGTTGDVKVMGVTAENLQNRIARQGMRPEPVQRHEVVHQSIYNLTMSGAASKLLGAIQFGGRIVFSSVMSFVDDMKRHGCNHTMLLVGDAEKILLQNPRSRIRNPVFQISVVGARMPPELRAALLGQLATEVDNSYSSNEAGRVAMMDADGTGALLPGVEVRICDQAGEVMPEGQAGFIRVRSDCVVAGYLNDTVRTAASFIDGWFVTGDWGCITAPGRLQVLGRVDDMLNVGGLKIPARLVEQKICALAGVTDAAIVLVGSPVGVGHLAVMIEVTPGADRAGIITDSSTILSAYSTCRLALSERLPRTETGKVRKAEIEDWFRRDIGFADA